MKLRSPERLFGLDEEIDRRLPRVRSLRLSKPERRKFFKYLVVGFDKYLLLVHACGINVTHRFVISKTSKTCTK